MVCRTDFIQVRRLTSGGFGETFVVQRRGDDRQLVMKVLRRDDIDSVERFAREVRLIERAEGHPHVVRIEEIALHENPPFYVMEYCERGSLRSWVSERKPWLDVVHAIRDAASGLSTVIERGGFHRDIKPDNLLCATSNNARGWVVKVADFGLARTPTTLSPNVTRGPGGTPGYMAPELRLGTPFTAACDIYSLGVTAAELLCGGRDPLQQLALTQLPVELRALVREMQAASPAVRPGIRAVIARLDEIVANDVRARNARRDLLAELGESLRRAGVATAKTGGVPAASAPTPLQVAVPTPRPPAAPAAQGGSGSWWAPALIAALGAGALALGTMNDRDASGRWRRSNGQFGSGPWS